MTQNLVKAHRNAYKIIKTNDKYALVGCALSYPYFQAAGDLLKPLNIYISVLANWYMNYKIRDEIKDWSDFLGLNFYQRCRIKGFKTFATKGKVKGSDMGWELYPQGILYISRMLNKYDLPIYITENGLADARDQYRGWYIQEVLGYVAQAIVEGIDVRGYFHWSLLDNFEWDKGFWPQFGLIHVNRNSLQRCLRRSACFLKDIIQ